MLLLEVERGDTTLDNTFWNCCFDADGDLKLVKILLAFGADLDCANMYGWRPLHVAAMRGNKALLQLLIRNGAELDAQCWVSGLP